MFRLVGRLSGGAATGAVIALALASQAWAASSRHAVMVIDANSGRVLMAEQADEPRYPASLTKMMTIYLALEQIEIGRLKPDTPIRISQEAANQQPSKLDLDVGQTIPALDAIKVLITKSANDVAVAVAEHIAGNEREFARRMTAKAQQLGMTGTTFRNASGLPDREQVTTARDMLVLAMRLHDDFPRHYALFALRSHSYRGKTFANHNTLLRTFEGTEGMKTGYIGSSGFNVATSFRRGPKHLFGVVFGGASAGSRNATMRAALTRALPQAAVVRTRVPARPVLVAEARPRPEPTAATPVPRRTPPVATQPAVQVPQPPARASTEPTVAPAPRPLPRPAPPVVVEAPAAVPVARVRPVLVEPRAKQAPLAAPAIPAGAVPAAVPQRGQSPAPSAPALLVAPSTPTIAQLLESPPNRQQAVPKTVGVGQPRSSLQAQARTLEPPAKIADPSAAVAAQVTGAYQLQIGAFASQADAERALSQTKAKANDLLGQAAPLTTVVEKDNRTFYRARFSGFSAQSASSTCLELRRLAVDCFVMRGE